MKNLILNQENKTDYVNLPTHFVACLALAFILMIPTQLTAQPGNDYCFISIRDMSHGKYIAAGESYDGNTYHQKEEGRDVTQWQFKPTGDGFYYIIDRRHQKALASGFNYDGDVYHQSPNNLPTEKWRLVPMGKNRFQIFDAKHNKALVAGDRYDGHLYHQDPGSRANSIWELSIHTGSGKAPREMIIGEKYLDVTYHFDRILLQGSPEKIILEDSYANKTNLQQERTLTKEQTKTVTETWSFSKEVSTKIAASIESTVNAGVKIKLLDVGSSVTYGFSTERTNTESKTNETSKTLEHKLSFSNKLLIPAGEISTCRQIITFQKADLPFTMRVTRTYGDYRKEIVIVEGTWRGNKYSSSSVECSTQYLNGSPVANSYTAPPTSNTNNYDTHADNGYAEVDKQAEYIEEEGSYEYEQEEGYTYGEEADMNYDGDDYDEESYGDSSYDDIPFAIQVNNCGADGIYYLSDDTSRDCGCWNHEEGQGSIGISDGNWAYFNGSDCSMATMASPKFLGQSDTCDPTEVECIQSIGND